MRNVRKNLQLAVEEGIISREQAQRLSRLFESQPSTGPSFDATHVLFYLGGLTAIGAMTLFMTLGWEHFGGWGIFFLALAFGGAGLTLAGFLHKKGHSIPAGICAAFAVALTPLALYGLQKAVGWWPDGTAYRDYHHYIQWHWIYLELGTLAVGAIIVWFFRYPFLLMPMAITLWYMSMDVAAMLGDGWADLALQASVSLYFGLMMTILAFWIDLRSFKAGDFAFWLYQFGVVTFWIGMTYKTLDTEPLMLLSLGINLLLIGVGVVMVRRVFVVFGSIGCAGYLAHLAYGFFNKSWLFPMALVAIGAGIVSLGLSWQRHERAITEKLRHHLPKTLRALLEERSP